MFLKNLAFVSLLASMVAAVPTPPADSCPTPENPKFGLIAIHSGKPVHLQSITASQGRLFIGQAQDATCDKPSKFATFTVEDDELHLYTPDTTFQGFFVDRSGMGQGIIMYTTDTDGKPKNGERTGFAVNEDGHLQFDGGDFQACPISGEDGAYAIWLAGINNPGGNEGCIGIALRAEETSKPVECVYTE